MLHLKNASHVHDVGHESRRGMYKNKSPSWKEAYRKRCLRSLRENRSKVFALRRNIYHQTGRSSPDDNGGGEYKHNGQENMADQVEDSNAATDNVKGMLSIEQIMQQEWEQMKKESAQEAHREVDSHDEANYIDSMVTLFEEVCNELRKDIQADLMREEEQLLRMQEIWEAELQREEDELCSAVERLSTEEVICPICEKSALIENKGIIFCSCGLRIDTEQDCISLKQIKANLQAASTEHSNACEAGPKFSLGQKFGITNLIMSCQDCDFFFIIV